MIRKLALVSAVVAATLCSSGLAAQSTATAPSKPAAAPKPAAAMKMKMKADSTTQASKSTARHAAWTQSQIKAAQQGLVKAGFYKGKATGVMNADTRKALREYQKKNKLPVTGRLSDTVLTRLKSA